MRKSLNAVYNGEKRGWKRDLPLVLLELRTMAVRRRRPRGQPQNAPPAPPPQQQPPLPRQPMPTAGVQREITIFYGTANDDVDAWLTHLSDLTRILLWDENTKLNEAIGALGPLPRREYASFEEAAPAAVTWAAFERFLRETYGPRRPERYWMKKLTQVRQTSHENVKDYVSRFRAMASNLLRATPADGAQFLVGAMVGWFTDGLRDEFQGGLAGDDPQTLEDAYRSAERAERVWRAQSPPNASLYQVSSRLRSCNRSRQKPEYKVHAMIGGQQSHDAPSNGPTLSALAAELQQLKEVVQQTMRL